MTQTSEIHRHPKYTDIRSTKWAVGTVFSILVARIQEGHNPAASGVDFKKTVPTVQTALTFLLGR
jgi:hypothetical protein